MWAKEEEMEENIIGNRNGNEELNKVWCGMRTKI
jgi:hypothetical protein